MLHTSLAAFTGVLSSVMAFRNVEGIIGKKGDGVKGEMPGGAGRPYSSQEGMDITLLRLSPACARVLLEWVAHYFHQKR